MIQIGIYIYENIVYSCTTVIFLSACTISWYFKSCLVRIKFTPKMQGIDRRKPNDKECIYRRAAHIVVAFKEKLYLWGGYMELPPDVGQYARDATSQIYDQSNHIFYHPPEEVFVYDIKYDIWRKYQTHGHIPPSLSGSCASVHKHNMYIFGGCHTISRNGGYYCLLWRLDLQKLIWQHLEPSGFSPYICDKSACWVYKDRLYIFGGYGPEPHERNTHAKIDFISDRGNKGWMDQFCYLDIENNHWVWPEQKGDMPSARAAHAATVVGNKAFIFGGRHKQYRLNDMYSVDLLTNEWTVKNRESITQPPLGRSWHTFNAITKDKIILYGGFSDSCKVFNDVWLWDVKKNSWTQLQKSTLQPRLWHSSAKIGYGEIIFHGGISNNILHDMTECHVEDMLVLRFSPPSLYRSCLDYVSQNIQLRNWDVLPNDIQEVLYARINPKFIHDRINLNYFST